MAKKSKEKEVSLEETPVKTKKQETKKDSWEMEVGPNGEKERIDWLLG